MSDSEQPATDSKGAGRGRKSDARAKSAQKTKPGGRPARQKSGASAQEVGEERSPFDRGRGARKASNRSGARKQGGRKRSRKSTGTRKSGTGAKRSGSESGGTKKKARGGGAGRTRGARGG